MKFKNLTKQDKELIKSSYISTHSYRGEMEEALARKFGVHTRTIRKWFRKMGLKPMDKLINIPSKILVYDIETSRAVFKSFWTGKQYLSYRQMVQEPSIITIAYKWLGDDEIKVLTWDENHCDRKLLEKFMKVYNSAAMVVGFNNDNFDNRWVNAKAMKYGLEVNTYVKSFDIIKQAKRLIRVPSYTMDYLTKFFDVLWKPNNEGIIMWEMVEDGTKEQQQEYLGKMIKYNAGDVLSTEELYMKMRKYMGHKMHFGVLHGGHKFSCPNCGGTNIKLYKKTTTPAGTIQIIMECQDDGCQYKISNKQYMEFLNYEMNKIKHE